MKIACCPLARAALRRRALAALVLLSALCPHHGIFAQGNIVPTTAPNVPIMKSLDQVEARTIVNSTNTPGNGTNSFVISQPGSYYLTGNITGVSGKNGILIGSNNVSLDLNGFQVLGVAGSSTGITDGGSNHGNAVIRHGTIRAWGAAGLDLSHSFDALISELIIADCSGIGMTAGDSCAMRDCVVRNNTGDDIVVGANSNLVHCTAVSSFGGHGINLGANSTITGCSSNSNFKDGFFLGAGSEATNCLAISNASYGFESGTNCKVENSAANQNQIGIGMGDDSFVSRCKASNNTGLAGIVVNSRSIVDACVVSANAHRGIQVGGILATQASSTVSNNTVSWNGNGTGGYGFDAGIYVLGYHHRIDNNHVADNKGDGITLDDNVTGHNLVVRNSCITNTAFQYRMSGIPGQGTAGDNDVGPIGSAANVSSPWANLIFF